TVIPLPGQIALIGPASGSLATADSGTFAWHKPTPSASRYWYEIALDSTFTSFRSTDSTLTDTVKSFRPLLNGQWYYWRVRGWNAGGWGPFSEVRSVHVIISSIAERRGLPETFALEQNHPNPFNPSTKIGFSLPRETHARLEIYNMLGQKVATALDEHMEPGYYTATFDASALPSGVYLYRLVTSSGALVRKMILTK
ncbi:T9SS C-terminal target domain-containing protein, partial [bacterium]